MFIIFKLYQNKKKQNKIYKIFKNNLIQNSKFDKIHEKYLKIIIINEKKII